MGTTFTTVNQVNASSQGSSSCLGRGEEGTFSTDGTLSLPPAPTSTTVTDALRVNPPAPPPPNGPLSVRSWKLLAQEQANLEPQCCSALYLRALNLFERELGNIVSRLTKSLASEIKGIAHQLESCALNYLPGHKGTSLDEAEVARNLLSRNAELASALMRVVEWGKPGGILYDLKVSSGRDTCENIRFLFLKNGDETAATIVLDNKAGTWVVGDIFFFAGREISKEFALLKLHTETPAADNVLQSIVPSQGSSNSSGSV